MKISSNSYPVYLLKASIYNNICFISSVFMICQLFAVKFNLVKKLCKFEISASFTSPPGMYCFDVCPQKSCIGLLLMHSNWIVSKCLLSGWGNCECLRRVCVQQQRDISYNCRPKNDTKLYLLFMQYLTHC